MSYLERTNFLSVVGGPYPLCCPQAKFTYGNMFHTWFHARTSATSARKRTKLPPYQHNVPRACTYVPRGLNAIAGSTLALPCYTMEVVTSGALKIIVDN
jgi:hypothetical protein